MAPLFDAHNHLHDASLTPHRDRVLVDLAAANVTACIVNGTHENDWPDVTTLCTSSALGSGLSAPNLLPAYGLHPWHVGNASPEWRELLLHHLALSSPSSHPSSPSHPSHSSHPSSPSSSFHRSPPRPALGEIGLDRWILDRARPDDPRLTGLRRASLAEQREAFTWQLALATEHNLPVTIHCIDAWGALVDVLRHTPLPARGFLLHAYAGSAELARTFADLGAYFSFNGYFLGERQTAKRDVFKTLPADRLLVETDAPAMPLPAAHCTHKLPDSPEGQRVNHPANLPVAYAALAKIRDIDLPSFTAQIAANFSRLFDFPLNPKLKTLNPKP